MTNGSDGGGGNESEASYNSVEDEDAHEINAPGQEERAHERQEMRMSNDKQYGPLAKAMAATMAVVANQKLCATVQRMKTVMKLKRQDSRRECERETKTSNMNHWQKQRCAKQLVTGLIKN